MKKNIFKINFCLLIILFCLCFIGCKKTKSDVEWINDCIEIISDEVSLSDETYISGVRKLYDDLTEKEKKKVVNYEKLVLAEEKIYNLKIEQGRIIFLEYLNESDVSVSYTSGDETKDKTFSGEELAILLEKLSKVSGEKASDIASNEEKKIVVNIGENTLKYWYSSGYFILNGSNYSILEGELNFLFKYFE